MATLIDTLKSQGKATDYYSRKSLYESMGLDKQYGAYSGSSQQNIGFQNILSGGKPSPASISPTTPASPTVKPAPTAPGMAKQPNPLQGISLAGLTPMERKYIEQAAALPSGGDLYSQYASEMGVNQSADLVAGLQRTTMDLEKKISEIEPMIQKRAGDFVISEGQRSRMVNAEQKPLRDQYLETARQLNYADAGLAAKKDLLATRLKYVSDDMNRPLNLLKEVIGFQKSGSGNSFDPSMLFGNSGEPKPESKPNSKPSLESILGNDNAIPPLESILSGAEVNNSAKLKTTPSKSKQGGFTKSKEKLA